MPVVEQHLSPDGLLRLIVERADDGDYSLGFDGYSWHTHADILASGKELSQDDAVRRFVDVVVAGRSMIAIARVGGRIQDVWITDSAVADEYRPDDETLEFRYWDGTVAPTGDG